MEPAESEERSFFRIVKSDPPTVDDFVSAQARGRQPPASLPADLRRLWDGLSVYATLAQASRKARQSPMIGAFIAELRIAPGSSIRFERTTRESGHHTVWGTPSELLACVTTVVPVRSTSGGGRR